MLRLLADENLPTALIQALRQAGCDIERVQGVGLQEAEDPDILQWAAENERIVVTLDRATMPDFAYERIARGERMFGMFVVRSNVPTKDLVDEIHLITECGEVEDVNNLVFVLP